MSIAFRTKLVLLWLLGASMGLLLVLSAVGMFHRPADDTPRGSDDVQLADESAPFTIDGDLGEPIRPGTQVALDVTISNPHDQALIVTDLRVTVESVHAPHSSAALPCSVDDFVVAQVPTTFEATVDAAASSTLGELGIPAEHWPLIGMPDSSFNQDGCKGAEVILAYTAIGRGES